MTRPTDAARDFPDLTDLRFWARPETERLAVFAALRERDAPVWFPERGVPLLRRAGGFHALVRHADVVEASRTPSVFSSEPAAVSPEPPSWVPVLFGRPMVNMDDPRHGRLRRVVSRAFAPRRLEALDAEIEVIVDRIVADLARNGSGDFVADAAARLPVEVICSVLGLPVERRDFVLERVDRMTAWSGVRAEMHRLASLRLLVGNVTAIADLRRFVARLGRERRARPTGDVLSALVTADVDGERLTLRELGSFVDLLLVAGNETVRNAASHALVLLTAHPDQRTLLAADPAAAVPGAVEEVVRYSSPIIQFRRTLTRDHELRGHLLPAGSKVVLFYPSANRDAAAFTDPDTFDVTRRPNPHVGFGGAGPHLCLGAHLARRQLGALLRTVLDRLPDLRASGPAEPLRSAFDHGIVRLPYTAGRDTRPRALA